MELKNRTAIVTGAGRGVGRAIAIALAREGANVVCAARREKEIRETAALAEREGGRALAIPTDVTQIEQVKRMVAETLRSFGQVDVLFNNAGSFAALGGIWEIDPDVWWQDVTVNLRGSMLCAQAVLPHMMARNEAIIINMSGGNQIPGGTGYSCSKVAVVRLTELMAKEQEHEGTKVLVVTMGPGFVRTEMTEYQVNTAQGRKWLPSSAEAFAAKQDRPPEDCARTTVELIRLACPEMNGHLFGAGQDLQKAVAEMKSGFRSAA